MTTHHPPTANAAATAQLRDTVATARRRLLDVLHARVDGLSAISSWTGPHRDRFDVESQALLDTGRALDDSLATLLYALDDELDAMRSHARRGLAGEAGVTASTLARLLLDPEVAPDEDTDAQLSRLQGDAPAAHPTGRSGCIANLDLRGAVVIPIRPDVATGR